MAITYSFNCTIKYRFSDELKADGTDKDGLTPRLSDSTVLYSCTVETTDVKVPLPDYLQGADANIQWYLSNTYEDTGKVASGEELTASQWTLTEDVNLGTFTSYDATITLYTNSAPRTLKWVYTQEDTTEITLTTETWQPIPDDSTSENYTTEYANFINLHAPKIPAWVSSKNGSNSTLYVFTRWKDPVKTADVEEYTIEADYSETTYDETNPYTLKSANPFADAEPYHYGVGTPPDGYFIPIGDDEDSATKNDVKVQAAEDNGYSNLITLNQFKIKSKGISYIEKGTFPLPYLIHESRYAYEGDADTGTTATSQLDYRIKKTEGDEPTIVISESSDGGTTWTDKVTITTAHSRCEAHEHPEELPKRLGFILTGGGGGSGGVSRIDPKSDGKNNDYTTPGGGGGGGEVVCGTFDLTDSTVEYRIKLGLGGGGGAHYSGNPDYDSPKYGGDGIDGGDSIIYTKKSGETDWTPIYSVGGGRGGKGGGRSSGGEGGKGGKGGRYVKTNGEDKVVADVLRQNINGCVLCQRVEGGRGGSDIGENKVQNTALSMKLYFSTAAPETSSGEGQFYISREYASITSSHNPNNLSKSANVPGGHSFGCGGTENVNPIDGAGGCCNGSGGRDGAGGYFGIYY